VSAASDPVAAFDRCDRLRQIDLDRFKTAGIPIMALVQGKLGQGRCLKRANVVLDSSGRRFELERFSRYHIDADAGFILMALDRDGEPADLVAWRAEPSGFLASWLGRAAMLGAEQLDLSRLGEPLRVHETPIDWLRDGREGVVVVDPSRAGPMLRDAGPIVVNSWIHKARLADLMTVKLPRIIVDPAVQAQAAE